MNGDRIRKVVPGADGVITGAADETITTVVSGIGAPGGLAASANGDLFWASRDNQARKRLATTGVTSIVATGLSRPYGVALDGARNLFIADKNNHRVRRVDATTGAVTVVAGTGTASSTGDGGAASAATLNQPSGVAFDSAGNLYVSERSGDRVRKIVPGADGLVTGTADETITTVATGLGNPEMLGIDTAGMLLVSSQSSHVVLRLNPGTGAASLAAGSGAANVGAGFGGDSSLATGLRVVATATGFTDASTALEVNPSSFVIQNLSASKNTLSADQAFQVRVDTPNIGSGLRVAQPLTVDVTSTVPDALTVTSPVTIASNATVSTSSTAVVAGTGTTTVSASANAATTPLGPIANAA
jgi:hypothetical protein